MEFQIVSNNSHKDTQVFNTKLDLKEKSQEVDQVTTRQTIKFQESIMQIKNSSKILPLRRIDITFINFIKN